MTTTPAALPRGAPDRGRLDAVGNPPNASRVTGTGLPTTRAKTPARPGEARRRTANELFLDPPRIDPVPRGSTIEDTR